MKANLKKIEGKWFASVNEDTNVDIHPENTQLLQSMEDLGWINLVGEVDFETQQIGGEDFARLVKSDENPENLCTKCYCGTTDWCDCLPQYEDEVCNDIKCSLRASLIYDPSGSTFMQWLLENYEMSRKN